MLEDLARFVDHAKLRPVIDRRFGFNEIAEAYAYLRSAADLGKVVIDVTEGVIQ